MVKMSRRIANDFKSQVDGTAPAKKRRKANANNANAANATASKYLYLKI